MNAVFITEDTSKRYLNMDDALSLTEESFKACAEGTGYNMERRRLRTPKGTLHLLAGGVPLRGVIGFKSYTSFRSGLIFNIHLFCSDTGKPLAIIEGKHIGKMRTGAASGVATKYMAKKDSKIGLIFGTGDQAVTQLEAVSKSSGLTVVYSVGRDFERNSLFAGDMSKKLGIECIPIKDAEEKVSEADIITTITTSSTPLFKHEWLKPGVHINAAGSNALIRAEIPEKTVGMADIIAVDSMKVAELECGDMLPLLEKGRLNLNTVRELSQIVNGHFSGRENDTQITLFESHGMGIQDVICAEHVYRKALKDNEYTELPF